MRIALAAEGTRGDIHPMLALGDWLRERGHGVRLCAPPDFAEAATQAGIDFHAVGRPVRDYLVDKAKVLISGGLGMVRESDRYFRASFPQQLHDLQSGLDGVDLVVGGGVQMGAPSIAELLGIRYAYVAYCPQIIPSREHPPFVMERQTLPPWANGLAWRGARLLFQWGMGRIVNRERRALGLAPVHDVFRHILTDRPILAVDRELAGAPVDCGFDVQQVPCLHPFDVGGARLPDKLEAFLAAGPSPVYIGFGSMPDPDPAATTRRLLAAIRARGCRAVISSGWAGLGDVPLPDDVFVTGPVPHPLLFPRMAAVVHHGGAGTTTTAARAGVPQILVPHVLDQFYWARRVERLSLGPPAVGRRTLTPESLADAIASTVDNEFLSDRAAELGERLRERSRNRSGLAGALGLEAVLPG